MVFHCRKNKNAFLKIDAEKKAQEENPVEQAPSSLDAKKVEETEESLKQAEANLSEERARLQALSQELSRSQEENKNLKSEKEEISKKVMLFELLQFLILEIVIEDIAENFFLLEIVS